MDYVAKSPLISICIPTYNRPVLLEAAIKSCTVQSYENFEILIGDDSKDDRSQRLVEVLQAEGPGKIRYFRNAPSLGQAKNVNFLFNNALGERLVLLHDDDLMLPDALVALSKCWERQPSLAAAFGKQHMIDVAGNVLPAESEWLNTFYGRTSDAAGPLVPGLAAIRGMFPNDGYMVLTERARAIGYSGSGLAGDACDFDFSIRYCDDGAEIWFVDQYTSAYRVSDDAISRSSITAPYVYKVLNERRVHESHLAPEVRRALRKAIERFAPDAVSGYARMGYGLKALRILLSSDYALRKRFRAKFLFHAVLTLAALVGGTRGVQLILRAVERCSTVANPRVMVR